VGLLLHVDATHMVRYDLDGTATTVAGWSPVGEHIAIGRRVHLDGDSVAAAVLRTGRSARMESYEHAAGKVAALVRELGLGASVGAPIIVEKRLWGVMIVSSKGGHTLPPDAEPRVTAFTELVATAVSNTETRTEAGRLTEEQAALRRVATLVARGVPEADLFNAVIEEVGRLFGADLAGMVRYDSDGVVSARRSAARSSSRAASGARSRSTRSDSTRSLLTPRRGSKTSPSWSPPRCRTSRRKRSSLRHACGSSRRQTPSGAASCAICMTERSSGSSTRSLR
jgi:GAF domain-containing protein